LPKANIPLPQKYQIYHKIYIYINFDQFQVTLIGQSHQASVNRWLAAFGNIFDDERNHWDIQYGNYNRGKRDVERDAKNALVLRAITPFLPPEVINFYNELTDREKYVLKELFKQDFDNNDALLDFLWVRSEKLYNKVWNYGRRRDDL
jgi:hypothetical protein